MGDLVNLRRFRKARDRAAEAEGAASNRAAFGRARGERDTSEDERRRRDAELDRHRLEPPPGGPNR